MFSIYVGGEHAHIKFGGWDQGAILGDNTQLSMYTARIEQGYGLNYTKFSIGGDDLVFNGGEEQSIIFDPSLPYIYLPAPDFKILGDKINKLFAQFKDFETAPFICDTSSGHCLMENSCDWVRKEMKYRFELEFTISDENNNDFVIKIPEDQMLREVRNVVPSAPVACFLPFYSNAKTLPNKWILGAVAMQNYYTVYDLTPADGSLSVGLAPINPDYQQDSVLPELVKDHAAVIVSIVVAVLVLVAAVCYIKKKRQQQSQNVIFETYQQYNFGKPESQNLVKKGFNNSETTSYENSLKA